jgi:murein L,D-transpeptidase YcbB/YkuD
MKRQIHILLLLPGILFCLSCKVKRVAVHPTTASTAILVAPIKQNAADFEPVFKKILKDKLPDFNYPNVIQAFYQSKNFQPVLVPQFLLKDQLQTLVSYLEAADQHGLNPKLFAVGNIKKMRERLYIKKGLTLDVYQDMVELELLVANVLLKYCSTMEFGLTDPVKIDSNYFTVTSHPDSVFIMHVLEVKDLKRYLDSIQPRDRQYIALQAALKNEIQSSEKNTTDTQRILKVNLERLRWKNRPLEQKFVMVNIADFSLDVMDKGKSILRMKVCVGEKDKQTPQLGSKIYSVQVNPVWNIPESIARNEISKYASRDRYYLANNNIDVFKNGKLVQDSESIDWSTAELGGYAFKQQPGQQNSLGKIKFLFKNESSVYLHDTPVKSAFNQKMRAISHGCVRVEKPLQLALALFDKGKKYDQIKQAMQSGYPRAKYIGLPAPVPVFITYYTARADDKGKVWFNEDVYGLDEMVYESMQAKR